MALGNTFRIHKLTLSSISTCIKPKLPNANHHLLWAIEDIVQGDQAEVEPAEEDPVQSEELDLDEEGLAYGQLPKIDDGHEYQSHYPIVAESFPRAARALVGLVNIDVILLVVKVCPDAV